MRLRDERRGFVEDVDAWQLECLNDMMVFSNFLCSESIKNRQKKLTIDTATAIQRTCAGLKSLGLHLLSLGIPYVMFGHFQSDAIEKQFGKYRQCSGGTYLITVQNVMQRFRIDNARKYVRCIEDNSYLSTVSAAHSCEQCENLIPIHLEKFMSSMDTFQQHTGKEVKDGLCYIAGYIAKKSS